MGNSSTSGGGGAYGCVLCNCTLAGNSASGDSGGGGAYNCTLYNCTLSGNSATSGPGGGAAGCTLYNSIVYFNTGFGGANYDSSSTLNYCCTTPLPTNGIGNIGSDPQLASGSRLSADSPCRGAGSGVYATGTDIDGEPWGNPPSIGCDEYHPGSVTGPLSVSVIANNTTVVADYPLNLTAQIAGRATDSVWVFGDGHVAINEPYISHAWTRPGDYLVALWVFNDSNPQGVSATLLVHVLAQSVFYVAATSMNPQPPYAAWATAATNIQDAVNAAVPGAEIMVSNGVYAGGVAANARLRLLSLNGPEFTMIDGGGWGCGGYPCGRCVSLADGASLTGFTVTNGSVPGGVGGGVLCASTNAFITNCLITGNWATVGAGVSGGTLYSCALSGNQAQAFGWSPLVGAGGGAYGSTLYRCSLSRNAAYGLWTPFGSGAAYGGGAAGCTLYDCTLAGNFSFDRGGGGGAFDCRLYNCTLAGNSTTGHGGGADNSALHNCIAYFNTAASDTLNYDPDSRLNYCCTTPLPTNGVGNITNAPLFIDYAGGNLRLQSSSPCINAGNNAYVSTTNDLDGNPRIVSGTADIGAYEYQGTGSVISYAWLQQYRLPTDGSADYADADSDRMNNWQEWVCGTGPTNASSALRLLAALPTGTNVTVSWQSAAGINYLLERSPNLAVPFTVLATNIVGQPGTTSYADTNATDPGPFFYRVGVTCP